MDTINPQGHHGNPKGTIMPTFQLPPSRYTASGAVRRVGFELEYGELPLDEAARIVHAVTGGTVQTINPWHYRIHTDSGTYALMLDYQLIAESRIARRLEALGLDAPADPDLVTSVTHLIGTLSTTLVPFELTTPPLPLPQLGIMEMLNTALGEAGALGTDADPAYAFGLHINVEAARIEAAYIVAILQAFFLLYDYLIAQMHPNITRRLSPYIDPFPESYAARVLDPAYQPGFSALIDDYLGDNPTRNRPLDLLPLLATIDKARIIRVLPDEKLSPRPAFHYRLPNSRIDDPQWSIAQEWNRWLLIERLAADDDARLHFCHERLRIIKRSFAVFERSAWIERITSWVRNLS